MKNKELEFILGANRQTVSLEKKEWEIVLDALDSWIEECALDDTFELSVITQKLKSILDLS